jgi:uncharacterized membrane protein YccF (DUF307 family)
MSWITLNHLEAVVTLMAIRAAGTHLGIANLITAPATLAPTRRWPVQQGVQPQDCARAHRRPVSIKHSF